MIFKLKNLKIENGLKLYVLSKMGIKDLNTFLRDKNVNCFAKNYPLSNLNGYRIGIDTSNFLVKHAMTINKEIVMKTANIVDTEPDRSEVTLKLIKRTLDYSIILMNNGITPIFVFDGKAEVEKTAEREKRREERKKRADKAIEIKEAMEKVPIYLRNVKSLGTVPKELWAEAVKYTELETELKKIVSTQIPVYNDEISYIKEVLSSLGVPCITGESEGEKTCAELSIAGETAATYSTDSDCLALGINLFFDSITGSKGGKGGFITEATMLPVILETFNFTMDEFRDFCILLGTDFNSRIKGYGPAKAFKLIEECRSIEKIEELKGLDISPLKYVRTRELLTPVKRDWSIKQLDYDFCIFEGYGYTVMEQHALLDTYKDFKEAVEYLKRVRTGTD